MVYSIMTYESKEDFYEENGNGIIAFETEGKLPESEIKVCGKLVFYGSGDKHIKIPDGIETLGYSFLYAPEWGDLPEYLNSVYIPASVMKIEEGAFANSYLDEIEIHKDSPCGIVKDGGLYTKDGKTLLFAFASNTDDNGFIVADGTERLGIECLVYDYFGNYSYIFIPDSVKEIRLNENSDNLAWDGEIPIKAPKGSYAIEFAKKHDIKFEEI